jgi:hypothetical protein
MVADFVLDDDGVTVKGGSLRVEGAANVQGELRAEELHAEGLRAPLIVSGSQGTAGKLVVHHPQSSHRGVILDGEDGRAYASNEVVTDRLAANSIVLTAASPLHPAQSGAEDLDLESALTRINERLAVIEQALGIP